MVIVIIMAITTAMGARTNFYLLSHFPRVQGNFVRTILGKDFFNYCIDGTSGNIWLFFLEQEFRKEKLTPIIINYAFGGLINSDGDIGNFIPNWEKKKSMLSNQGKFYYNIP